MLKSETIASLAKALVKFKAEHPKVTLDSSVKVMMKTGGSYNFKYASLPCIKDTVEPVLSQNGLAVTQIIEDENKLTTILIHESGEYMMGTMVIGTVGNKPAQEVGSLITYARRYAYCAILGIIGDEDDDANTAVGNTAAKQPVKATPKVSSLDPKIQAEILACQTRTELGAVRDRLTSLKDDPDFKDAITVRWKALPKDEAAK